MKRLRKWWKPALAVALAATALQSGASMLVRTAGARSFLTRQLASSFGRPVEVREYSASLLPTPQLDAEAITVGEDPAFGQEYFLRADRLTAGLRWIGLLRGRFELGTLQLDRPSLILARNSEGRWNLERWLPQATSSNSTQTNPAGSAVPGQSAPTHLLRKIAISEGRVNFKLGDDKTPFAFVQVEGTVEQMAPGRWRLDLEAEPWRSGVPLQIAGTVRVRGDVAGTSARLQPAHLQVSWEKGSLADVFRLIGGRDLGVRGEFAAEATAESGGLLSAGTKNSAPGDWMFSLQARASRIHRWDLTERDDNPRIGLRVKGRWNPGAGTTNADEVILETPRSNLRGSASLKSIAQSSFEVRVDSAGVQAADFLDWYRAFGPDVAEGIRTTQYFTGAANFSGWPLVLNEAAFSSQGGRWSVPGFASALEAHAIRGGIQRGKFVVEPFAVSVPLGGAAGATGADPAAAAGKDFARGATGGVIDLSLAHDFQERAGGIRVEGQVAQVESILAIAAAFGRNVQHGWEVKGRASADLYWGWGAEKATAWSGRADLTQATVQVAGLNRAIQLENLRAEWHNAGRKFTFGRVAAFGATWSGSVEQTGASDRDVEEGEVPEWAFDLQANHLDAAELDRWIGPRARPNWLQRLLPSPLGGGSPEAPSALLKQIRARGDLRVEEVAVEKIKLTQFRAHASLESAHLQLQNAQAQWAGGAVQGSMKAVLSGKPSYEVWASVDHVSLGQTPWLAPLSDRLAGSASGTVQLHAEGIGKEALLKNLSGKGEMRLARVELRGWDVAGTMAQGAWKTGVSRWASGAGTFHVSDGGFELNALKLVSASDQFLLKGSVSFSQETDLMAESHAAGHAVRPETAVRFLTISGPLTEPKVSLEKATAQQPGD